MTTLATAESPDTETVNWRWWRLAQYTFTRPRLVVGLVSGLLGGLGGLVFVLVGGPVFGLDGRVFGVFGLVIGLAGGLASVSSRGPAHIDRRIRDRVGALFSKLVDGLLVGLAFGLALALVIGVVGGLNGSVNRLVIGLAIVLGSLVAGLALGLIKFAGSPSTTQRASSPVESQRGDRQLTVFASVVGLVFGLLFVPLAGLVVRERLVDGLSGLVFGLVFGLLGGPVMTRACWPAFVVASLWLGMRRRLPFALMRFLDDAHRLGFLRIVGPVYQFRHADLQKRLRATGRVDADGR